MNRSEKDEEKEWEDRSSCACGNEKRGQVRGIGAGDSWD